MTTNSTLQNVIIKEPAQDNYLGDLEFRRRQLIQELRRIEGRLLHYGRITQPSLRPSKRDRN